MGQTNGEDKGKLTARQFGEFAKRMAHYVIGQNSDKPVVLLEDIEDGMEKFLPEWDCYMLYARGRRIPETESYNVTFLREDIARLKKTAEKYEILFTLTPILAYVCVDNMDEVKKIRVFWMTLEDAESLGDDLIVEFLNYSQDGLTLRYTEGPRVQRLAEIKDSDKIKYVELQFNE